jgi:hypothetical protein
VRGLQEYSSSVAVGEVLNYATKDSESSWFTTSTTLSSKMTVVGIQISGWKFAEATSTSGATTNVAAISTS